VDNKAQQTGIQEKIRGILTNKHCISTTSEMGKRLVKDLSTLLSQELQKRDEEEAYWLRHGIRYIANNTLPNVSNFVENIKDHHNDRIKVLEARLKEINNG